MAVYQQELDNMVYWDGRRRPFYEAYYLRFTLPETERAFWIRYALLAPRRDLGPPSASVWAIAFDRSDPVGKVAVKETLMADQSLIDRDIFYFQVGENAVYNNGARGKIFSGGHELRWDLQFIPNEETQRPYPLSLYHLPFPKTKFLSPNWSVRLQGEVAQDGKNFRVQDAPGCQAHLWGTQHADRWAWSHCNAFREDPDAVFEALTGQVRWGKKLMRPLTSICLRLGDGRFLRFNRFSQLLFNESLYGLAGWELNAHRGHYRVKVSLQNRPAEMVGVTYTDPDGSKLYCYHAEAAELQVQVFEIGRKGDQLLCRLSSPHAAYEIVERAPIPELSLQL